MSTATEVENKFQQLFNAKPLLVRAPGRINLLGEHMDYNLGNTICAAINMEVYFATAKNNSPAHCKIFALDYNELFEFDLNNFAPAEKHWSNYLTGVVFEMLKLDKSLSGFDCVFGGTLPQGAGLSSSAAITSALAFSLNRQFNLQIENMELAKLCQRAENNFAGVKCGLLDPFSILFGKKNQIMALDFKTYAFDYLQLESGKYTILLFNTNVEHNLARSGHLNERFASCYRGVEAIQKINPAVHSLGDTTFDELESVKNQLSETDYNRCKYVLEEMQRFNNGTKHLSENNFYAYAQTLFETHSGMKNLYGVSCFELDVLVEHAQQHEHIIGAKMMGGGYGGCTINIVSHDHVEMIKKDFEKIYFDKTGKQLSVYEIEIADGVGVM